MTSPIERLAHLVIGSVESVSPNDVRVLLELDAPHSTALNTGTPASFPRINGYVLIPNESGATVGYIAWIGIERSPYPKRSGMRDFGLVDLPFPLRKMAVSPVGTLTVRRDRRTDSTKYELTRGVLAFPSVGDQVLMPTPEQIEAIVGAKETDRRVRIGSSPMAANAAIMVDPDKLFGRHLAILGNTGSGKSCTVAGLIRWSMEAAKLDLETKGRTGVPNARFVVLDPNGEYAKAFADQRGNVRVFRVPPIAEGERELDVPAWLWNGHEWTGMAYAQPGAQRPLLLQGIRELKTGNTVDAPREAFIRKYLRSYEVRLSSMLNLGTTAYAGTPKSRFECFRLLSSIASDCRGLSAGDLQEATQISLNTIAIEVDETIDIRRSASNPQYFDDFLASDLEAIRTSIRALADTLPELESAGPISEDDPSYFEVNMLAEHLEKIATEQGGNLAGFISTLGLRIRGMLADRRLGPVIARNPPTTFSNWLKDYVGEDGASNGQVAIVDLSLVPSEIVHVVVAVLSRLVFESLQRYRRLHPEGRSLPTVLVLEEAHTFVKKGREDDSTVGSPSQLCREIFERIAREGRKFGLGLVLSSQRPSELSPTILAQCNTFLLHRIVNDADQKLVGCLVPDNVAGLLAELPSLPSQQAILLGWATPIPVLVEIDELDEKHRPLSADPDFWDVWTKATSRPVNWDAIASDWSS